MESPKQGENRTQPRAEESVVRIDAPGRRRSSPNLRALGAAFAVHETRSIHGGRDRPPSSLHTNHCLSCPLEGHRPRCPQVHGAAHALAREPISISRRTQATGGACAGVWVAVRSMRCVAEVRRAAPLFAPIAGGAGIERRRRSAPSCATRTINPGDAQ